MNSTNFHKCIAIILFISLTSCGTMMRGGSQNVSITSEPSGADVMVDGKYYGQTPQHVLLKRNRSHTVTLAKEGYHTENYQLATRVSPIFMTANVGMGGLVYVTGMAVSFLSMGGLAPAAILAGSLAASGGGIGIDLATGGAYSMPKGLHGQLQPRLN